MKAHIQTVKKTPVHETSLERIHAFSDGVFAIIITIMVLELKHPHSPTFAALFSIWPTWISYIVSYAFIAIVWVNHHYLLKHSKGASLGLMWVNFAHLFFVSLIPFLTDWIAETRLAPVPVALYALIFLSVNATYFLLIWQIMYRHKVAGIPRWSWRLLHLRSVITMLIFCLAMIVAFWWPYVGFGLVCLCLLLYLRPDGPGRSFEI
jgi:uncharacterized membrane protein